METSGSSGRKAAALLGLGLVGLGLAALLGELFVRATWSWSMPAGERPPAARPQRPEHSPIEANPDLPVLRTVFELGGPNARGIHKGLPFRTNSRGVRGPEYSPQPAPGTFRIVVGGDSVTMGSGVLEEEAYPALLERMLQERHDGRRYQVINLGLSGLNTDRVVERIERIGADYHPDLIVYGYTLNDIEGPDYIRTATPEKVGEQRRRYRRFANSPSRLLRAVWPRWLALQELLFKPPGTQEYDVHTNYFENPAAWGLVLDGLDRLAALARRRGLCVVLLVHTGNAQLNRLYPFQDVNEKIGAAAAQRGFAVVQTFPYFEGRDPTALRLSFFDSHPNPAGHQILATALYEGLHGLPARCWETDGPAQDSERP